MSNQGKHVSRRMWAVCALALVVAGCRVDQVKEVETYRKILEQGLTAPEALRAGEALSLERAMALANWHNEQLSLRGEDYLQALIDKNRAVAGFLPQFSFTPSWSVSDAKGTVGNGGGVRLGDTITNLSAPVNGNINLFRGFGDQAAVKRADFTIAQRESLLRDLQSTLLLNVGQAFYQVARAEKQVEVLSNSLAVQQERVRDVEARQKAGLVRPLDVSQTQAQAAGTAVSLTQAQTDALNGRRVLAFLIGEPVVDGGLDDQFKVPGEIPALGQFENEAQRRRQDLQAAQQAVRAARANVDVQIAQYYPSINFNATAFLYRENFEDAAKWTSLLSANLPIFSAGLIEASVRTAWSQLRQAALSESLLRRQVFQDVQVAYQNLLGSTLKLKQLQVQVASAAEAMRQAEQSYRVGLATNLDRLTAQDQLLTAQLNLAGEQYNNKVFYLNLQRVMGVAGPALSGAGASTQPTTQGGI